MDTLETLGKLWYLGAAVVAIAAYAVTIKVRVDYLEKTYGATCSHAARRKVI